LGAARRVAVRFARRRVADFRFADADFARVFFFGFLLFGADDRFAFLVGFLAFFAIRTPPLTK